MPTTSLSTRSALKVPREFLKKPMAKPGVLFVWDLRINGCLSGPRR